MVLIAMVMVTIFFLAYGAMQVQRSHQDTIATAHQRTFNTVGGGLTSRFSGLLGRGGVKKRHGAIVRPSLGRFRTPRGWLSLRRLPNKAYLGKDSRSQRVWAGDTGFLPRVRLRAGFVIAGSPPWAYHGSDKKQVRNWYKKLMRYGIKDVYRPLRLAREPALGRGRFSTRRR